MAFSPIGLRGMADPDRQSRNPVACGAERGEAQLSLPGQLSSRPALAGRRRPAQRAASAVCRLARSAAGQPTRQRAGRGPPGYLRTRSLRTRERAPHAASDATDLPATNAQDKPTCRSERFPDAWPHHRRYPARGSPPGAHRYPPRYAPPAARRARRYARVPPMDSGDEPLPMIKRGPFSMPMGGPFSTPIDTMPSSTRLTKRSETATSMVTSG